MAGGALGDIRVLDLSTSVAGAWCSRALAGYGADVILVEPPDGHPLRHVAPFDAGGRSIPALAYLASKRSVVLDLDSAGGQERARELATRCDVVISSSPPSQLEHRGLTYARFGSPALIFTHITPFGMIGERTELPANDLTISALSGWASVNGWAEREPLKLSGRQASLCAGEVAAIATLAALHHRDTHPGDGQEVDVAELDANVSTFAPALLRGQYSGEAQQRRKDADITAGPVPVADGHFALTISRAHFWRDAMNVLGLEDLANDPRWESGEYRAKHKEEYVDRVQAAMAGWRKMDLFHELGSRRVIAGPVLTMEELLANEQLAARSFWAEFDGLRHAGAPAKLSETPWALRQHEDAPP
jgi:crotonobetainyl-CoA:carnitine CoA-transferase CaiB-like acyl-CoA transferase